MGNVLSLGKARKRRARDEARKAADANAIRHGRSKAERAREAFEARRAQNQLEGHRRSQPQGNDDERAGSAPRASSGAAAGVSAVDRPTGDPDPAPADAVDMTKPSAKGRRDP